METLLNKFPIPFEIINLGQDSDPGSVKRLQWLTNDGTVYYSSGSTLYKSSDWAQTDETVTTASSTIMQIYVYDENNIIIGCFNGNIEKYDGTSTTIVTDVGNIAEWSQFEAYQNFVLASGYVNHPDEKMGVYLSTDYGENWNKILQPAGVNHPHAAVFDPYEGLIWAAFGDGHNSDIITYSIDLGKTWEKVESIARCTSIMPLPDCVLFGTDEYNFIGAYKYTRTNGIGEKKPIVELFYNPVVLDQDSPLLWATRPAIDYANGMAYWGIRQNSETLPAAIYASDGHRVRNLWTQDKIVDFPGSAKGIQGVWGPDNDGNIVADLRSQYNGYNSHILKINIS